MISKRSSVSLMFVISLLVVLHSVDSDKRPTFNGSIFGKRASSNGFGNTSTMVPITAKIRRPSLNGSIYGKRSDGKISQSEVRYAMCESVWKTCSRWFPTAFGGVMK
ncbi:uncharacterized protein LOC143231460 [Tachypleus tridentatus]|uniref:uncharacterized protein LOC143231460 n=1 Tax=Tachypleus tridentatus TaxID=6853 RepID=UPI003FD4413A